MSNLAPFRSEGRNAENKMEADDRISPSFSSICEEVDVAEWCDPSFAPCFYVFSFILKLLTKKLKFSTLFFSNLKLKL